MKKILILFISAFSLLSCSSDDSSSGTVNSYSDFEQVIYRFQFRLNPDVTAACGDETNYPEARTSYAFAIENDYIHLFDSNTNSILGSFINDETNSTPSISEIDDFSESHIHSVVSVNKIPLRNVNYNHDFSFFESIDDVITVDVDVTGLNYFNVSARYKYEKKHINDNEFTDAWCSNGIISGTLHDIEMLEYGFDNNLTDYLDYAFVTYEIQGNKLIIFDEFQL